jgi:hypothetical protein
MSGTGMSRKMTFGGMVIDRKTRAMAIARARENLICP